jgi:hypothetical protein
MEGGSGQLQLLSAGQEMYQILTPEGNIQVGLLNRQQLVIKGGPG